MTENDEWECNECKHGSCFSESLVEPENEMCRYFGQFFKKQKWVSIR